MSLEAWRFHSEDAAVIPMKLYLHQSGLEYMILGASGILAHAECKIPSLTELKGIHRMRELTDFFRRVAAKPSPV